MTTARLRLISTSLAAAITLGAVYLAVTQRFPTISNIIFEPPTIDVLPVRPLTPQVPMKVKPVTPPPELTVRETPTVSDAPPTVVFVPEVSTDPAPPRTITDPTWLQRPSGRDFARYYPDRAIAREREGRVVLDCIVGADGRIVCSVASEDPVGWGFGEAALRISRSFQMSPRLENGQATEGGRVRVPINFRLN